MPSNREPKGQHLEEGFYIWSQYVLSTSPRVQLSQKFYFSLQRPDVAGHCIRCIFRSTVEFINGVLYCCSPSFFKLPMFLSFSFNYFGICRCSVLILRLLGSGIVSLVFASLIYCLIQLLLSLTCGHCLLLIYSTP